MKVPSAPSLEKLSQLQRLILVALLEERYSALRRAAVRRLVKRLYWGERHCRAKKELVAKSLSRALARLEERGLIVRSAAGWRLTDSDSDLVNNGYIFAICAWQRAKELYALLGLTGPLVTRPPENGDRSEQERAGVHVELHFPFDGVSSGPATVPPPSSFEKKR